jgi:geranylgeranyl pyrophosphate synthase
MKKEIKPGKTYLYITTKEGKTFKLDAKAKPLEWPGTGEQKSDAKVGIKTYTATLTFKMGKRMRAKMIWTLNGCKTRKDYRRFKKLWKRVKNGTKTANKTKNIENPKVKKCLMQLKKFQRIQKQKQ